MAASSSGEFEDWLDNELKALNTDQEVIGGYITSILEGEETDDEKIEALEGILSEISEEIITPLCKEILLKWTMRNMNNADKIEKTFDVNEKIVTIMEQQTQRINATKKITDEEKQYRDAIVAQYSHVSDDDDESSDETNKTDRVVAAAAPHGTNPLVRNVNAESVVKAEKERREQAKLEVEKKKAQDKVNREKQKQLQLERKEKEKKRTQKGERRR